MKVPLLTLPNGIGIVCEDISFSQVYIIVINN